MIELSEKDGIRFSAASQMIPSDVQTMLDVGCGEGDFLNNFVNKKIKTFAVDRDLQVLAYTHAPKSLAFIGSLPFSEEAVDMVTCMEVIEHLPHGLYEMALLEISRVAKKYILITVPYKQDLKLMMVQCPFCFSRFNHYLHIRSFDEEKISQLLGNQDWVSQSTMLINEKFDYHLPSPFVHFYRLIFVKEMPFETKCPICGYEKRALLKSINPQTHASKSFIKSLKSLLVKIVPKKKSYSWIAGLYVRN
jgi:SAM-dependent methyltransferase